MHSLISDRFLKQFFENRLNVLKDNPEGIPMMNEEDKLTGPGYFTGEEPLEKEAKLENKKTSEANILNGSENGSIQPANDQ